MILSGNMTLFEGIEADKSALVLVGNNFVPQNEVYKYFGGNFLPQNKLLELQNLNSWVVQLFSLQLMIGTKLEGTVSPEGTEGEGTLQNWVEGE